ncbi:MAG: HypC/HybG/HupF family hydrogenase formation chaperone [Cyclobacteriaceae bacterium]|jgi:hydrogenase expression/formation protein HypC
MCLAIPGKVILINESSDEIFKTGVVSFDGINREVNLAMVPEVQVNDYVLVHVGVAIQTLDEEEAMKTMEYLKELEDLNEELGPDINQEGIDGGDKN